MKAQSMDDVQEGEQYLIISKGGLKIYFV